MFHYNRAPSVNFPFGGPSWEPLILFISTVITLARNEKYAPNSQHTVNMKLKLLLRAEKSRCLSVACARLFVSSRKRKKERNPKNSFHQKRNIFLVAFFRSWQMVRQQMHETFHRSVSLMEQMPPTTFTMVTTPIFVFSSNVFLFLFKSKAKCVCVFDDFKELLLQASLK